MNGTAKETKCLMLLENFGQLQMLNECSALSLTFFYAASKQRIHLLPQT